MPLHRRGFVRHALLGSSLLLSARAWASPRLPINTIGASADLRLGFYETVDVIRNLGFQTIEIQENHLIDVRAPRGGTSQEFCLNPTDRREQDRIRRSVEGFAHVSAHLPWSGLNYGAAFGPAVEESVLAIDEGLKVASHTGACLAVLHARPGEGMTYAQSQPVLVDRIRRWADVAAHYGIRLAVETGTPASVHEFVDLIGEIGHPNVGATLDLGHQKGARELLARVPASDRAKPYAVQAYNDINIWLVENLGPKLFHLHVHDLVPETWSDHQPLKYHFIDFPRLFTKLQELNYRGLLVLEIGPMDGMQEHLRQAKEVLEQALHG